MPFVNFVVQEEADRVCLMEASIEMQPIGHVHTAVSNDDIAHQRRYMESEILILPEYAACLDGIEEYSHLFVLFWMDRIDPADFRPRVHPRGRADLPLTGVLATRTRHHPNPIGLAVVELVQRQENTLRVRRLDAFDQTPVLDIKPYDDYDVFTDIRVAQWWPGQRL